MEHVDITIGAPEPSANTFAKIDDDGWSLSHVRLEAHYFAHGVWLEDSQLFNPQNLGRVTHIPLTIIQGRYDVICPPQTAWELHKLWRAEAEEVR
ncbi:hypothetical protein BGW36DRAFT_316461 [Talaromyces proteolyticus]|uniref:Prolyl aminopeptidase n=1 Tax=Talaromyces proteolyticus TaxID=1131652 RepID=A0AAD4L083_9EURO|nr:uncharacterized protein BGW36DRAFT_316461 [Talaromyces proteolyticus]KAH8700514.1 hypothetical protein BGW36DRAFT_316461 [Talaromyces proteolyticus]